MIYTISFNFYFVLVAAVQQPNDHTIDIAAPALQQPIVDETIDEAATAIEQPNDEAINAYDAPAPIQQTLQVISTDVVQQKTITEYEWEAGILYQLRH